MKDKIYELIKLMQDYPGLEVKLFVASDELLEDYAYTSHDIKSVEISQWCKVEEHIFIDEDELSEFYTEMMGTEEETALKLARENLIDVILIKTGM